MPPRNVDYIADGDKPVTAAQDADQVVTTKSPPLQIVWRNVVWFAVLHLLAIYGFFLLPYLSFKTHLFTSVLYLMNAFGITAGAHRLWTHRAYHAKLPLRIFLGICNSMAFQNDIIEWTRDHRLHHKFSETDADPHNANRGFFFAHCGWLMCRKHPEIKEKGKMLDLSDLFADPVCVFQRKYYLQSVLLLCFIIPTVVPWYFWNESLWNAYIVCAVLRYVVVLNFTWCVNSVAHLWGNKPYDRRINPVENLFVTVGAAGEGFHNYHHAFPSDYACSEHGWRINPTTVFIDLMAFLGQVTDRKVMDKVMVEKRMEKWGDGTTGFNLVKRKSDPSASQ